MTLKKKMILEIPDGVVAMRCDFPRRFEQEFPGGRVRYAFDPWPTVTLEVMFDSTATALKFMKAYGRIVRRHFHPGRRPR